MTGAGTALNVCAEADHHHGHGLPSYDSGATSFSAPIAAVGALYNAVGGGSGGGEGELSSVRLNSRNLCQNDLIRFVRLRVNKIIKRICIGIAVQRLVTTVMQMDSPSPSPFL